jgi:hypothetical protein
VGFLEHQESIITPEDCNMVTSGLHSNYKSTNLPKNLRNSIRKLSKNTDKDLILNSILSPIKLNKIHTPMVGLDFVAPSNTRLNNPLQKAFDPIEANGVHQCLSSRPIKLHRLNGISLNNIKNEREILMSSSFAATD